MQVTIGGAVTEYERELRSLGRAEATVTAYMIYLRKFARTAGEQSSVQAVVSPEKITRFFETITTPGTRNLALSALRGFLPWCVRMKYIGSSAAAIALGGRQTKTVQRQPKHYVEVDEFPALLDAAGEAHPIERAVIALALYTLCRQGEIIGLRLRDVDLSGRELRVYRPKRQRHTTVTISPDLAQELMTWLTWYAERMGFTSMVPLMREHSDWPLIPYWVRKKGRKSKDGQYEYGPVIIDPPRSPERLEDVLKRALTAMGVRTRNGRTVEHLGEGIHTIRRSGARALLDHLEGAVGADRALLMVSAMLDHDDTQMTLRYIGRHIDKQRLDAYLKSNSMYGPPKVKAGASVIPMRRAI